MDQLKQAVDTATAIKDAVGSVASTVASALGKDAKSTQLADHTVEDPRKGNVITTNFGVAVDDTDNSLKAGERGPTLMEDFHFREKISHFDHERIPERVVHARGTAAHGYFELDESLEEFTRAQFLSQTGKRTPVFVRFSTVLGSRGSADTVRDVRGFAVKFYTDEGNFDLVGNNIPVFFIQDAIKFPDVIHAGKPEPHHEMPQAQTAHDNFWDFISLTPESAHMIMWTLSDRAIPRSYRTMQGFGVHSFVLVNKEGQRRFVKFHFIPRLGTHSLVWDEAQKLGGTDPDFHRRDLYEAIEAGAYPEWDLGLQIVDEADEHKFDFDLLDATKIIPEELVPVRRVGRLVLNRNTDNFFCETEQVAYCTSHLVPGIEASNDPLLQGRQFSYFDTQLTRLGGPNFEEIPINRPVCPVTNNQRDGFMRQKINKGQVNYYPNRFGCPALADPSRAYVHAPVEVHGRKRRARGPKFAEHYRQATLFYNSLSWWEKAHLVAAASFELGKVDDVGVRERMIDMFNHIDFELATRVADAIGVQPPKAFAGEAHSQQSPALSQANTAKDSIATRKIAFLVAPGFNNAQLTTVAAGLTAAGAMAMYVGPRKGQVKGDAGSTTCQFSYLTARSVMFDGVVVVGGGQHIAALSRSGECKAWINESFKHGKPIAALEEGVDFVQSLGLPVVKLAGPGEALVADQGVVTSRQPVADLLDFGKALFNAIAAHRHNEREVDSVPA